MITMRAPLNILLVEDNPGDVDLIIDALSGAVDVEDLKIVPDGEEAMVYLHECADNGFAKGPDLILLDLNLPRKDGREVLAEIKAHAQLKHIPVVVLTSSEAERDLMQTYQLHANSFITKPTDLDTYQNVVRSIEAYWGTVVRLPPRMSIAHELALGR